MTAQADLQPRAAWDARDPAWWTRRQEKTDWLNDQGLPVDQMYRIEFLEADCVPCARIFCYALNEDGHRYLAPGGRDAAAEPPRMVPLDSLPPGDLLGVPA